MANDITVPRRFDRNAIPYKKAQEVVDYVLKNPSNKWTPAQVHAEAIGERTDDIALPPDKKPGGKQAQLATVLKGLKK